MWAVARQYGLTPEQFAENLADNYQRNAVGPSVGGDATDVAKAYVSTRFQTPAQVLEASNYMLAMQLAHEPLVRQCVRETFYAAACIDVAPTRKGLQDIDQYHALNGLKFLKNKPVTTLKKDDFLRLSIGEQDKLISVTFRTDIAAGPGANAVSYEDHVKQLFQLDEFSTTVREWNELRAQVVSCALELLYADLVKELRAVLLQNSKDYVLAACRRQLHNWLKVTTS